MPHPRPHHTREGSLRMKVTLHRGHKRAYRRRSDRSAFVVASYVWIRWCCGCECRCLPRDGPSTGGCTVHVHRASPACGSPRAGPTPAGSTPVRDSLRTSRLTNPLAVQVEICLSLITYMTLYTHKAGKLCSQAAPHFSEPGPPADRASVTAAVRRCQAAPNGPVGPTARSVIHGFTSCMPGPCSPGRRTGRVGADRRRPRTRNRLTLSRWHLGRPRAARRSNSSC